MTEPEKEAAPADFRRTYEVPASAQQQPVDPDDRSELGWNRRQSHRAVIALEADGESTCRSCSTPLIWAINTEGTAVPINREPDPTGTVGVNQHDEWVFGCERQIDGQQSLLGDAPLRYRLHYETCPDRERWHRWGIARRRALEAGDR